MISKQQPNLSTAEQIALWADKIRDHSATGFKYTTSVYDRERYEAFQTIAMEMFAYVTAQTMEEFKPLRKTFFSHVSPLVAGAAAIIDEKDMILLMRRSDNGLWVMPGGALEVGETPAEGVVREAYEETGIRCKPIALSGVYDSRVWDNKRVQHLYKFTFLCEPLSKARDIPSHQHETLDVRWFARNNFPDDLYEGHIKRIEDAYKVKNGKLSVYFDYEKEL